MPRSIHEVKKRYEPQWLKLPGVVSIGIGLNNAGRSAIIIGLDNPTPKTQSQLPSVVEGYPVEVRIVGNVKAR